MLLSGAAVLPASLFADVVTDSLMVDGKSGIGLDELVVTARRNSIKEKPDRIIYMIQNDPYASGLDAVGLLDRMPRISVVGGIVSVAGKHSVKYIIDGHLLDMPDDAIALKLKNLQADGIEKIELLATPPARYSAADNVAYISITTRNESLGTKGNLWGSGAFNGRVSYSTGASVSHSTRKVELSADLSWSDSKGINDTYRKYLFEDHERVSDRENRFTWRNLAANGLFKYKFDHRWSAGIIVNYSAMPIKSMMTDITSDGDASWLSESVSPARPDNSVRFTAFADWIIDNSGKMMSLTYNFFDRDYNSCSDVCTYYDSESLSRLEKDASNIYRIHSIKLDTSFPLGFLKIEAGGAFTAVDNNTDLRVDDFIGGDWVTNPLQTNTFDYLEKTVAAYVSAEKNFTGSLFGKIGLRYEHTSVRGLQHVGTVRSERDYGYLFPSVLLSWNSPGAGRFSADYSMGISRPSFGDLNPFRYYTTVSDYFTGNPDLDPSVTHNAGLNYSFKGVYAVVYGSWRRNAVGYINRFNTDGMQWTMPENCLDVMKAGLYASYNRSLFDWWNLNVGGEVFYSSTTSDSEYLRNRKEGGWSGKLELNTSWMLNRKKTLILNLRTTHYFPCQDGMFRFDSRTLLNCDIRYMLLDNRLVLSASVSDPFSWSVSRSTAEYAGYIMQNRTDIHSHSVSLRISWSFGRSKVNNVYRDTKERESGRSC